MDDCYWKIKIHEGFMTLVCLQDFDEKDYDQNTFARNKKGEIHIFKTEEDARIKLHEWYKVSDIDPEYRNTWINPKLIRE